MAHATAAITHKVALIRRTLSSSGWILHNASPPAAALERRILPRQTAFLRGLSKERPMAWKRPARREFLKGGAALASGLTVAAIAPDSAAQTSAAPAVQGSSPPMHRDNSDEIRYGARSKYVT